MPTIGEVYDPIVKAALTGDLNGHALLEDVGAKIFENNKDKCSSVHDGLSAARKNLDYYCQYYGSDESDKVKEFYGLGKGFRLLDGTKL